MLNLAVLLEDSVRNVPDRIAVICGDVEFTYRQINEKANQIANALKEMGIGKDDKVALSCPNLPFFPMIYYGILKAGATVVPLNVLLKGREIAYHLDDSDAKVYFCFEGTKDLPMSEYGFEGFSQAEKCEQFILINTIGSANAPDENSKTFTEFIKDQPTEFTSAITESRRYRRDSLHFRNDRTAERRGTDASEYHLKRAAFRYDV